MHLILFFLIFCSHLLASTDWSINATLPGGNERRSPQHRANILQLDENNLKAAILRGKKHAFVYPVEVTELLIPYKALKYFFETPTTDPLRRMVFEWAQNTTHFQSMDDVYYWLGVHQIPENEQQKFPLPWPILNPKEKSLPMGATLIEKNGVDGLTFSCAACHSGDLFGVKVLGLTNRFPRANDFFRLGKTSAPYINADLFQLMLHLNVADKKMFRDAKKVMKFIGVKKPAVLGLDTSLAQVGLSLARRGLDENATRNLGNAFFPRSSELEHHVADSKPAVWWNLKYKTRWLSDGSIVQGNPILTNFLWNEIGRGIDLLKLEDWIKINQDKINDLTASVFASSAPEYLDFFPENSFNLAQAKRGQKVFTQYCQRCHGEYKKAWDQIDSEQLNLKEKIKTTQVWYHKKTPVFNVGTDPGRFQGMKYFYKDLNRLKISKSIETIVEPQNGYVPPPLVGIWARWPYFHNNSVSSLCEVLTRSEARLKTYVAGPAINQKTDYDTNCIGYPRPNYVPEQWKKSPDFLYDTSKKGLSNSGHDEGIFLKDGQELLTSDEKRDLIEFLKSL